MSLLRYAIAINLGKPLAGWRCYHCRKFLLEMRGEGEIVCPKCGSKNLIKG